jgi:hypothetical protein
VRRVLRRRPFRETLAPRLASREQCVSAHIGRACVAHTAGRTPPRPRSSRPRDTARGETGWMRETARAALERARGAAVWSPGCSPARRRERASARRIPFSSLLFIRRDADSCLL